LNIHLFALIVEIIIMIQLTYVPSVIAKNILQNMTKL
jgi:hypothetical protein